MCDKLLEILEKFKNSQPDYKINSNEQIFEWLSLINICEDNDYLCEVSSKIKNNLHIPIITSDNILEESKSPQLSPKSKIFQSIRSSNSQKAIDFTGSSESPRHLDSSRSIESPRPKKIVKTKTISKLPIDSINNTPVKQSEKTKIPIINVPDNAEFPPDLDSPNSLNKKSSKIFFKNPKNSVKNKKVNNHKSLSAITEDIKSILNKENVSLWTTLEVTEWLKNIGFSLYCDIFLREEITGIALLELTNDNLKNDLHIDKLGHRITIIKAISTLK
jgi:hypothetical protein